MALRPLPPTALRSSALIAYRDADGAWQKYALVAVDHDPEFGPSFDVPVGPFPLREALGDVNRAVAYAATEFALQMVEFETDLGAFRVSAW